MLHRHNSLFRQSTQCLQSSAPFIRAVFAHVIHTHAVTLPEEEFHITSYDFSGKHYFAVLRIHKVTRMVTVFNVEETAVFLQRRLKTDFGKCMLI